MDTSDNSGKLDIVDEPVIDSESEGEVDDSDLDPDFEASDAADEDNSDSQMASTPTPKRRKKDKQSSQLYNTDIGWNTEDIMPDSPVFQETTGVTAPLDDTSTPFDCFAVFMPLKVIKLIKTETNRYAGSIITKLRRQNKLKPNSLWGKWQTAKLQDIYLFFAIIIHMCIVQKPKLSYYWSKSSILHTPFPASIMSRDRFKALLSNLHISNNEQYIPRNQPNYDPLFKIRPFFDHLNSAFSASFAPYGNLTVDEGMCGFRGRIHFRVYMKNKPDKYGIKLFVVCDAYSGYVLKIEVYSGKGAEEPGVMALLKRLLENYVDKGFPVYMDRYYSSPAVFDYLWEHKTKAVGTCMANRKGLPQSAVVKKTIKKGEVIASRRNHLLCLKWRDTRDVLMLSTCHTASTSDVVVRSWNGPVTKTKPDVVLDYNVHKTGVDRSDQMIAYYPFKRKQLKWWKKLFFHLFVMSATNAFVLYRETRNPEQRKKCSLVQFLIQLGNAFVKEGNKEQQISCQPGRSTNRLNGRHFPAKIPATEKKANPTRVCKVCTDRSKHQTGKLARKETSWWCPDCSVALCVPDCFKVYHTNANYV